MPASVDDFRDRLAVLEKESGLSENSFAKKIGLKVQTYRNMMGRGGAPAGKQGPSLEKILVMFEELGSQEMVKLLVGQDQTQSEPEPTSGIKTLLDMARAVLEAEDPLYTPTLIYNLKASYEGLKTRDAIGPPDPSWPVDPVFGFKCRNTSCGHHFKIRASTFCQNGFRTYCPRCGTDFVLERDRVRENLAAAGLPTDQIDEITNLAETDES